MIYTQTFEFMGNSISDEQLVIAFYFDNFTKLDREKVMDRLTSLIDEYKQKRIRICKQIANACSLLDRKNTCWDDTDGCSYSYSRYDRYRYVKEQHFIDMRKVINYLNQRITQNKTNTDYRAHLKALKDEIAQVKNAMISPPPAYKESPPPAFDRFDATKKPSAPAE